MSRIRRTVSPHAAPLRIASTDAERRLWAALRDRRFAATKFRRQHSIGPYIADFACVAARLVIELDGGQHGDAIAYDERRTACLAGEGWRVIRFWNREALTNLDGVLRTIDHALRQGTDGHPHPGPAL
ncbi:MAG: endonuclease domain-containing protein [Sphingomonadaceae bacterium]|nr:endonuclease domain-containing protein [Sphingomonadaceae bacterium]